MNRWDRASTDAHETTFLCEWCGRRVPARKLYGRRNVIDLAKGQPMKRVNGQWVALIMACSKYCSHRVKPRIIPDAWLTGMPQKEGSRD